MSDTPFKGKKGMTRLRGAVSYSVQGFSAAFHHEEAFRQEVFCALVMVPLALLLPVGGTGKALMIGSVLLVLIVELVNSAIEATIDRISLENHRLAKRAKDLGSAAVALAIVNTVIVWLLVLLF